MTFDPMAAAVDWLDAYKAADLETILSLYAADAEIECWCGSVKTISGREALRVYWEHRFRDYPVSELDDLHPSHDGAVVTYIAQASSIRATLEFNGDGKISFLTCRPSN